MGAEDDDQFGWDGHAAGLVGSPVLKPAFVVGRVGIGPAPVDLGAGLLRGRYLLPRLASGPVRAPEQSEDGLAPVQQAWSMPVSGQRRTDGCGAVRQRGARRGCDGCPRSPLRCGDRGSRPGRSGRRARCSSPGRAPGTCVQRAPRACPNDRNALSPASVPRSRIMRPMTGKQLSHE